MPYRSSSFIKAIGASPDCICEGSENIKCPTDECNNLPEKCQKAKDQHCFQYISIFDKQRNKFIKLRFTFTISDTDHDGYINENDSTLEFLLNNNFISKDSLVKAAIDSIFLKKR